MKLRIFRYIAIAGALCAVLLALSTLLGYLVDNLLWASLAPGYIPMAPSTALCFLALSGIVLLRSFTRLRPPLRYAPDAIALLVALYGFIIFTFCMSGRALFEALHTHVPGLHCLYMSGYTADIISNHGVLEEGLYFLQKPFTRRELAHKVREVLQNST